jgi:glycosyltransferase involved in cell wall biosynthesis
VIDARPSPPAPYLSLVLACYNEEPVLLQSFAAIRETLLGLNRSFEVVFVDDASRDRTGALLERIVAEHRELALRVIRHDVNRGRGAAVSDGFRAARGEIAGYLDVDLEVHCRYIPSLLDAIEHGADVATVRRVYAIQIRHLDRYAMSRGYSWLVRRLLGTKLRDTETGYKFFRREKLLSVLAAATDPGWFWDTEFMIHAERSGLVIAEIPGAYVRRSDKPSTLRSGRESCRYLVRLLRFRARLARLR